MTPAGWMTMILSVGFVTGLFAWCIYKVITTQGEEEKVHGFEMEPPDKEESEKER